MFRRALELEKQIEQVQRSTKTLFKFFVPIHNWLRMKSKAYYNWSLKPYSHFLHWAVLFLCLASLPLFFLNINGKLPTTQAAGTTFTEDFSTITHKDATNTTAVWDTASRSVSVPYEKAPYLDTGGDVFPGDMVNTGSAFVTSSSSANNNVSYIFGGQKKGTPNVPNTTIYRYDPAEDAGHRLTTLGTVPEKMMDKNPLGKTSAVYAPDRDKIYI